MSSTKPAKAATNLKLSKVTSAIGSLTRWRMLAELGKEDGLPAAVIARRVRITANAASKHLLLLHEAGLLDRGYQGLYYLPKAFRVPGENALDVGPFVIRLDYPDTERK